MSPAVSFALSLGLTVVLLVLVILTGREARIRAHVPLVIATVLMLAVTIYFAERLGDLYDLKAAGRITPVHLFLAKITTVGYLAPLTTGVMTYRDRKRRRIHAFMAYGIFFLTVLTFLTGTWMILASPPL